MIKERYLVCGYCGHKKAEHHVGAGCEHEEIVDGQVIICTCLIGR